MRAWPGDRETSGLQPVHHHSATKVVSLRLRGPWSGTGVAKSITLKNLPEALHARLAASARRHRRSLSSEAIVCLEAGLAAPSRTPGDRLAEIRALRLTLPEEVFDPLEIDALKREGRP